MKSLLRVVVVLIGVLSVTASARAEKPGVEVAPIRLAGVEDKLGGAVKGPGFVRLQLEREPTGKLIVEAVIAGKPLRLIVDSGAGQTWIDRERTKSLGLKWTTDATPADNPEPRFDFGSHCVIPELRLGSIVLRDLTAYHYDTAQNSQVNEMRGGKPYVGLIGADIFTSRHAIIDYKRNCLYLRSDDGPGVTFVPDRRFNLLVDADRKALDKIASGRLYVMTDDDTTWRYVSTFQPTDRDLQCDAGSDGHRVFAIQTVMKDGSVVPADLKDLTIASRVFVMPQSVPQTERTTYESISLKPSLTPADSKAMKLTEPEYVKIPLDQVPTGDLTMRASILRKRVRLTLDTAAGETWLDRERTKPLGLNWTSPRLPEAKSKDPWDYYSHCTVPEIDFGGAVIRKLTARHHDATVHNDSSVFYGGMASDGLIGADILAPRDAIIDYKAKCLLLKSDAALGIQVVTNRSISLPVQIDPKKIDTIERCRLWVMDDQDVNWRHAQNFAPTDREVKYEAATDGQRLFAIQHLMKDGSLSPADPKLFSPAFRFVINVENENISDDVKQAVDTLRNEIEQLKKEVRELKAKK